MAWIREGTCCRCGECCTGDPNHPSMVGELRKVPGYCPMFEWKRKNKEGFCRGHVGAVPVGQENAYYMSGCNVWPTHPDLIADKPSCTYKFHWVD